MTKSEPNFSQKTPITLQEVNRVLDLGRLLLSVLSEQEKANLSQYMGSAAWKDEIGNTGVS